MDRCVGNLNSLPDTDYAEIMGLFNQVGNGLKHIASNGFSHGDVKAENILLVQESGKWKALIADFGLVGDEGGTPIFVAPEGLRGRVTEKSDIYSLGMTIFFSCFETQLATRLTPFLRG